MIDRPTGTVQVALDAAGCASYEFAADTAWDRVAWSDSLQRLAERADAVCFGTLGSEVKSRARRFCDSCGQHRRNASAFWTSIFGRPLWTEQVVLESLPLANVLKMNDTELPILASLLGPARHRRGTAGAVGRAVFAQTGRATRGAAGAVLLGASGERSELPAPATVVVDTVGAGDSFTAALVIGLLSGLPLATMNAWGNRVAAFVSSQPGATPHLPGRATSAAGISECAVCTFGVERYDRATPTRNLGRVAE